MLDRTDNFNPYQKWLGIRVDGRPDCYKLLGLDPFEDDRETISHAADQRIEYVRGLSLGAHQDVAQRLLNELAAAKVCLLAPDKKSAYDRELRLSRAPAASAAARRPEPPPVRFPAVEPQAAAAAAIEVPLFAPRARRGSLRGKQRPRRTTAYALVTAAGLIAAAAGGILFLYGRGRPPRANARPRAVAAASPHEAGRRATGRPSATAAPEGASSKTPAAGITASGAEFPVADDSGLEAAQPPATEPADYLLTVTPTDAAVRVDGPGVLLATDGGVHHVTVAAPNDDASFRIRATCPGYSPKETLVFPRPGESRAIQIALAPVQETPQAPPDEPDDRPSTPPIEDGSTPHKPAQATPRRLPPAFDVIWLRDPRTSISGWELELHLEERLVAKRGEAHARQGLRPSCVVGYVDEGKRLSFAAVWVNDGLDAYVLLNVDARELKVHFDRLQPGFLPGWCDAADEGRPRYSEVFVRGREAVAWQHRTRSSLAEFNQLSKEYEQQGLRLIQRRTQPLPSGQMVVCGLWLNDGHRSKSVSDLTTAQLQGRLDNLERGWRPTCVDAVGQGTARMYTLVTTDADTQAQWQVSLALSGPELLKEANRRHRRGYVPVAITAE